MNYAVFPTNKPAVDAVAALAETIDKRLGVSDQQKEALGAYILGHRRQDTINLTAKSVGHPKVLDCLLSSGVLGRAGGRSGFFVQPKLRDLSEMTFATEEDGSLNAFPVSKSGLWYRSKAASKFLNWEDTASVGFSPAYFIAPVDFAQTVAAFRNGYRPSAHFQSCDFEPDQQEAERFKDTLLEQARLAGVAIAPIADGYVCADPQQALNHLSIHAVRVFNRPGLAFSVVTKDQYGRAVQSWGAY